MSAEASERASGRERKGGMRPLSARVKGRKRASQRERENEEKYGGSFRTRAGETEKIRARPRAKEKEERSGEMRGRERREREAAVHPAPARAVQGLVEV
jgi:hypothetical protein